MNQQKYRYGFEATRDEVVSEWLFYVPKLRETKLFERELDKFDVAKKFKADGIPRITRRNALFLSVSAQFNVEIAEDILAYLMSDVIVVLSLNDGGYRSYTANSLKNGRNGELIRHLLKTLDLGFGEVEIIEEESPSYSDSSLGENLNSLRNLFLKSSGRKLQIIRTEHQKFDGNGVPILPVYFDLDDQESEGTQKVFALVGPLVDTLIGGKVLIFDELDSQIHPLISHAIIELFNSNEANPNNAQLIFATHDTNLLSNRLFRRDQIWFAEKNSYGATDLYSLAEYKVRNDASFESDYIKGKYGAIPYIGNLNNLIDAHA